MDRLTRDRLEELLFLQSYSLLDDKTAPELERLQRLYPTGMTNEQSADQDSSADFTYTGDYNALAWAVNSNNPPFGNNHQNPASSLVHNGGQNALASSAALGNPLLQNHYQNSTSNLALHGHYITPPAASFNPSSNTAFTNNSQNQPEQRQPARNSLGMSTPDAAHTHTQGLASIAATSRSFQTDEGVHADAAAIMSGANSVLPPPRADGLRFQSYASASAASDRLFRAPIKATDDDVVEVEQNKQRHVRSLLDALKYDSYMPPPYEWRGEQNKVVPLTEERKVDWVVWQDRARESCRSWMKMPDIDVKLECAAWEIFEEILKVHRTGAKLSKQTKTKKSMICSQRVQEAVQTLRDWALVRLNMINNHKIPIFAANPIGYAHKTYCYRRNNSGRSVGADAEGEADAPGVTGTGAVQGDRGASENGAIASQCMPAIEVTKRKRKASEAAKKDVQTQQKKKPATKTKAKKVPALPSPVHDQASIFSAINQPSMLLPHGSSYEFSGTSGPEPAHAARHGSMAPPPSPISNQYGLGGSVRTLANLTLTMMPDNVNGLAASTQPTFASSIGNTSIGNYNDYNNTYGGDQALYSDHMPYDNQMMYGTQHQRHREADVNDQGRPAAAFDAAASLAVPAQPFSTQGGMPGGNVNKRQRMA
jgi:hypothetical protein